MDARFFGYVLAYLVLSTKNVREDRWEAGKPLSEANFGEAAEEIRDWLYESVDKLTQKASYKQMKSYAQKWMMNGAIDDKEHSLSSTNLKIILLKILEEKKSLTKKDINTFLSLGKSSYRKILSPASGKSPIGARLLKAYNGLPEDGSGIPWETLRKTFESSLYSQTYSLPVPFLKPDKEDAKVLLAKFSNCQTGRKPLLLYGEPGAGKTTLMAWIATIFKKNSKFDAIRWIRGVNTTSLREWLEIVPRHLLPEDKRLSLDNESLTSFLNKLSLGLHSQRILLLLDNCCSHELPNYLVDFLPEGSAVVLTAANDSGMPAHFPESCRFEVKPVKGVQAVNLYREYYELSPKKKTANTILALSELVEGNLYALTIAFADLKQRDWNWGYYFEDLKAMEDESSLQKVIGLAYSRMDVSTQRAFRLLGGIQRLFGYDALSLSALWGVSLEVATSIIKSLEALHILEIIQPGYWQIHEEIRKASQKRISEEEKIFAEQWLERLLVSPQHQQRFNKMLDFQKPTILQLWHMLRKDQKPSGSILGRILNWKYRLGLSSSDWEVIQRFSYSVRADEYATGYHLVKKYSRKSLALSVLLAIVFLVLVGYAVLPFPAELTSQNAFFIPFFLSIFLVIMVLPLILGVAREKDWYFHQLWNEISKRNPQNQ